MKKHIKVNGKILQTNKQWSHLPQKQKEHISNWLRREYTQFVRTHHRKPRKYEHDEILHEVMNQIFRGKRKNTKKRRLISIFFKKGTYDRLLLHLNYN